jgi:hypothetical protein
MREILFRGKCVQSGEWVEGDLIHGVNFKYGKVYILPIVKNLAYVKHCDPMDGVEILPETVSQFTGMVDKNKKRIFENDVCSQEQFSNGFVRFDYGWAIDYNTHSHDMPQYYCDYLEIIGNRFDNAEMLDS